MPQNLHWLQICKTAGVCGLAFGVLVFTPSMSRHWLVRDRRETDCCFCCLPAPSGAILICLRKICASRVILPAINVFLSMHSTLCMPRRETERIRCFGCFSFEQGASRSAADLLNEGRPRSPKLKVGLLFLIERWTSMSFVTCATHSEPFFVFV